MNKTGKIILSYIIAVLVVMAIFVGYKNLNKRPQGGNTNSTNQASNIESTASSDDLQESGRTMVNLTLDHLKNAFTNPYHVEKYYDDLVNQNVIERYEYNTGENHIVLIYEKDKMEEFSNYYKDVIDKALNNEYLNYNFEMSSDYSTLTMNVYPDTDFIASFRDLFKIYFFSQTYVLSTLENTYNLHVVVKRAQDGVVIGEAEIPGGAIDIIAEDWTGIEDHDEAVELFDSNLYSFVNYTFPEIKDGKYYCNAGGFCFDIPEGTEFTSDEVNNQLNELEDSKDILAVKKKLSGEVAYMESNLVFDDSTFMLLGVNYLEGIEDDPGFADYTQNVYIPDLKNRDNVTIKNVTETYLHDQYALCIDYVDGDKNCKLICFYRNGLCFYLSGTYKNSESEKVITDFYETIEFMN